MLPQPKIQMNTLFDKIWDAHTVKTLEGGSCILYIDRQYIHEVTSPQAFEGLRRRGAKVFRPQQVTASPDHNIPCLLYTSDAADD